MGLVTLLVGFIVAYTGQFLSSVVVRWNVFSAGRVYAPSNTFEQSSYSVSSGETLVSVSRSVGSGIPTSVLTASEVSLVDYEDGSLLLLVVLVCSFHSSSSSTVIDELRGPAVTFDNMQVS